MAGLLDYQRYGGELRRQLLRRIGYTNGLHDIRRFSRVVEYLHKAMPTSVGMFADIVVQQENVRDGRKGAAGRSRGLGGRKYAQGIVDVATALMLVERVGPRISLSSQGYGCHALVGLVRAGRIRERVLDCFLLQKVIEADGEYSLNILRLIGEGVVDLQSIGGELMGRFAALIRFKAQRTTERVGGNLERRALGEVLLEAEGRLQRATSGQRADLFLKHTVGPRVGWLVDLGCAEYDSDGVLRLRSWGRGVLEEVQRLGGWVRDFVHLPLDGWLARQLALEDFNGEAAWEGVSWRLAAASGPGGPQRGELPGLGDLLHFVRSVYGDVKLDGFNEADALALFEVLAAVRCGEGLVLSREEFDSALVGLVREYPAEVFKLSRRRGYGLYIGLRRWG